MISVLKKRHIMQHFTNGMFSSVVNCIIVIVTFCQELNVFLTPKRLIFFNALKAFLLSATTTNKSKKKIVCKFK